MQLLIDLKVDQSAMKSDLQMLNADLQTMKADQSAMKSDLQAVKADQKIVHQDMVALSEKVSSLQLHIEQFTDRNITLLMEQYNPNVDKLNSVSDDDEVMKFDIGNLKRVVLSHSQDIIKLMNRANRSILY